MEKKGNRLSVDSLSPRSNREKEQKGLRILKQTFILSGVGLFLLSLVDTLTVELWEGRGKRILDSEEEVKREGKCGCRYNLRQ